MAADKMFTQAEVNGMIARAKKEWETEREQLSNDLSAHKVISETAKGRVAELEAQIAASSTRYSELEAKHTSAVSEHKAYRLDLDLKNAFGDKLAKDSWRYMRHFFPADYELSTAEDGTVSATRRADGRQFSLADAAEEWLKANPTMYVVKNPPVGAGSKLPNGGGGGYRPPPQQKSPGDLIAEGLKTPAT